MFLYSISIIRYCLQGKWDSAFRGYVLLSMLERTWQCDYYVPFFQSQFFESYSFIHHFACFELCTTKQFKRLTYLRVSRRLLGVWIRSTCKTMYESWHVSNAKVYVYSDNLWGWFNNNWFRTLSVIKIKLLI